MDLENYGEAFVRATATGKVTAATPSFGSSVAAAADNRTFYVLCATGNS